MGDGLTCRWYDVGCAEAYDYEDRRNRIEVLAEVLEDFSSSYRDASVSPGIVLEEDAGDTRVKVDLGEREGKVRVRCWWSGDRSRREALELRDRAADQLQQDAARIELPVTIESDELHDYLRDAFDRYDRAVVSGPHSVEEGFVTQYRSDDGEISVLLRENSSYDHLVLDGTGGSDAVYEEFRDCMMAALGDLNLLDI